MKSNINNMPLESIPIIGNNMKLLGWSNSLLLLLLLLLFLLLFIHLVWRYNSTCALVSSILHLQAPLSSTELLQFPYFNVLLASLFTSSNHFPWAFQLIFSLLCILSVLPGAPFHPAASSYDPPTGVFAI